MGYNLQPNEFVGLGLGWLSENPCFRDFAFQVGLNMSMGWKEFVPNLTQPFDCEAAYLYNKVSSSICFGNNKCSIVDGEDNLTMTRLLLKCL